MTRALVTKAGAAFLLAGLLGLAGSSAPAGAVESAGAQSVGLVSVIVTLEEQATLAGITGNTREARQRKVIDALRNKATATQPGLRALLEAARRSGRVREFRAFWVFNGFAVTATPEVVALLARRPDVQTITPDTSIQAPLDAAAASTPEANIALVGAPDLWALGHTGGGIVVASMDTGVELSHPDLSAQWRGGTNSWFDPNGQHPTTPIDRGGHGTRTMGVMVGRDAGGTAIGVAPDAQWIAVKIFNDSGVATVAGIHAGFQWLLDPDGNPATPDAPHVVNNSWTFSGANCNLEFQLDLQALRAASILPVFAAGNYGPSGSTSRSPANNPEALAVGATTKTDAIWTSSSRGPSACADPDTTYPELVAPGAAIRTTDRFGGYVTPSGTSLAAPHVTGAIALLLDAHPEATPADLETALESSALDLGSADPDSTFGYGRLDALAAHERFGTAPPDFTVAASPSSRSTVAGGAVTYTAAVTPSNGFAGDVSLSVSGLPAGASASFDPTVVAGGSGSSLLSVSTAASTPAGSYPLTIQGTSGSRSHTASVTLVIEPEQDFTVAASPASASTSPGGSVTYAVSVGSLNGFAGDVALTAGGLPPGASGTFSPASIAGSGSAQLIVATSASTPSGTSTLTITGTSGSLAHATTVELVAGPTSVIVFPSSVTIVTGTFKSGSPANLGADDSLSYEVNSNTASRRAAAWYGRFLGVPNGLATLAITYKGKNSRTCAQTVAVWSWATSSWLVLDAREVGTSEALIADFSPAGTLADYVSGTTGGGEVRARVRCQTTSGTFVSSGNLLHVRYS